jgi:hypothetical protein
MQVQRLNHRSILKEWLFSSLKYELSHSSRLATWTRRKSTAAVFPPE